MLDHGHEIKAANRINLIFQVHSHQEEVSSRELKAFVFSSRLTWCYFIFAKGLCEDEPDEIRAVVAENQGSWGCYLNVIKL